MPTEFVYIVNIINKKRKENLINKKNIAKLGLRYNLVGILGTPNKEYCFKNAPIGKVEITITDIFVNILFKLVLDNLQT